MTELDFIKSRGIGECVCGAIPELAGNFGHVAVAPGHERNLVMPDLAAYGSNGIAEGAVPLRVPSSRSGGERRVDSEIVRPEGDE